MIANRVASLQEVAGLAAIDGGIRDSLRDFLDGFYAAPSLEKLKEEPDHLQDELGDDGFADAYLAATAAHLCRQYRLPPPEWTKNPCRILKVPFFAAKTHGLRMIYLQESPTAFKERNIFVSANTLSRA